MRIVDIWRRATGKFATPGFLLGLLLVIFALYGSDRFLANLESREIAADARRLAATGDALERQGHHSEAIDAFRRAHAIKRDNRDYQLALARALLMNAQPSEAIPVLDDVLDQDSNDGPANLLMARAMTQQRHNASADSFYHRAIYGAWPVNQQEQPIQARLELVRWLSQQGEEQSLLAELIPLEQRAHSDPAVARALPELYEQAGSLSRAEEAYRALIRAEPDNAEAYAGLGRVQMQKGSFHAAEQNFADALQHNPNNEALGRDLATARSAHELDPTSRHLPSEEKLSRSNRILAITIDAAQGCSVDPPVFAAARQVLVAPSKSQTNEMAELRLDAAEKLWHSRPASCGSMPEQTRVLAALLHKIEQ